MVLEQLVGRLSCLWRAYYGQNLAGSLPAANPRAANSLLVGLELQSMLELDYQRVVELAVGLQPDLPALIGPSPPLYPARYHIQDSRAGHIFLPVDD